MKIEFISIAIILLASAIVFGRWYENLMMFAPDREHTLKPEELGLAPEEVSLHSGYKGEHIDGWFFDAGGEKTILYIHGNAGNISDRLPVIKGYVERGLSVFIFDYRGYGKSDGRPTKKSVVADSFRAYDYLVDEREINPENITILGQSLGGVPASKLANARKSNGLITEGTFYSIRRMAQEMFQFLPIWIFASPDMSAGKELKKLKVPLLIIHGRNDNVIPVKHSSMLFDVANEPKELFIVETATHVDMYLTEPENYYGKILEFINKE